MALRKEVFQSKVLHKLYSAASRLEKESTATPNVGALTKKTIVKRNFQGGSTTGIANTAAKRIYTVVPPPADYKADSEKSVTHAEPENLQSVAEPDENSEDGSSSEQAKESEEKKKRRRRKKRKDAVPALHQTAGDEGEERLSKNKKRKLKKKRHKEKMLSMGLVPRAAAVEFTYQRDRLRSVEDEKEVEECSREKDEPVQEQEGNP